MSELTQQILQASPQARVTLSVDEIKSQEAVWILTDEDGCVMLTTDDEDGIPVWPSEALAKLWATDEWEACKPLQLSLSDWMKKWVPGMMGDALVVMVCPVPAEEGEVMMPDEFAELLLD